MEVAIVTGASRGIGRAIALNLSHDFFVIVNYLRNEKKAMDTAAMIENGGGKAMIVQGDVSSYEDAKKIVETAANVGDIHILVNNAGVYEVKSFSLMRPSEWERIFQVNTYGPLNMTHAVVDYMNDGVIVNIASVIGIRPMPRAAPYSASKSALIAFTRAVSEEFGSRIKVVCVAPGPTNTDMLHMYHSDISTDPPEKVADYVMYAIRKAHPGECVEVK